MKTVTVTVDKDQTIYTITVSFDSETMPEALDTFIQDHVGGRPDDRR